MKIYAIKDRLLEYFQQPFVGQSDKQVMAALSTAINNQEQVSAISQAPHHFELYELGEVDEDTGHIKAHLSLLADCASLVRRGVRRAAEAEPGTGANGTPPDSRTRPPGGARGEAYPG